MIDKFVGIVNGQLDYWTHQVETYGPGHARYRPTKIAKYQHLIREFTELRDHLASQSGGYVAVSQEPPPKIVKKQAAAPAGSEARPTSTEVKSDLPDDLAGLPPELLKELSEGIKGETDPLIKIINGRGGTATLDEILIDLYRKYG